MTATGDLPPREGQAATDSREGEAMNGNGRAPREAPAGSAAQSRPACRRDQRRAPGARSRVVVDPLPAAVAAAGAGELVGAARDRQLVRLVQGGVLIVASGVPAWRLPLVTAAIAVRAVELLQRRPTGRGVLWLAALNQLRRELSRAHAWEGALSR